jgi:hypothetical protein
MDGLATVSVNWLPLTDAWPFAWRSCADALLNHLYEIRPEVAARFGVFRMARCAVAAMAAIQV